MAKGWTPEASEDGALTTCWAWCGTHCPTAPAFYQIPRSQTHGANLYLFKKKDHFVLLFIVSGTWASPSVPTPHSKHGVSGGERLPCPGPREVWPLHRGHYLRALSLWDRQTHKALTTSLSVGRTGSLSPSPLFLTGPFAQPHSWEWESLPTLTQHSSLPWPELLPQKVGPMILGREVPRVVGGKGLQAGVRLHPLRCPHASFASRSAQLPRFIWTDRKSVV